MKHLKSVLVGFCLLLTLSIVYAATNGTLSITGTATLATDVKMEIEVDSDIVYVSGNTYSLSVEIPAGEVDVIKTITIKNTGKLAAKITNIVASDVATGISVVPDFQASEPKNTVAVGNDVTYDITVTWEEDTYETNYAFTITISYAQAS